MSNENVGWCSHPVSMVVGSDEGTCYCLGCVIVDDFKSGTDRRALARKYKVKVAIVDQALRAMVKPGGE